MYDFYFLKVRQSIFVPGMGSLASMASRTSINFLFLFSHLIIHFQYFFLEFPLQLPVCITQRSFKEKILDIAKLELFIITQWDRNILHQTWANSPSLKVKYQVEFYEKKFRTCPSRNKAPAVTSCLIDLWCTKS